MIGHEKEQAAGSGISDYIRTARQLGYDALVATLEVMDAGERTGRTNPHCIATERIRRLGMPVQEYIGMSVEDFLASPHEQLAMLPDGDYYFVSIVPGTHLARGKSIDEVVAFVQEYADGHPDANSLSQELYVSHNGEPVMSAHIVVNDQEGANADYMEATVGNFNAFHRGAHSPEIIVRRGLHAYSWEFRDALASESDWRDATHYECNGGVSLTRIDMASRLYGVLSHIPHDGTHYLPGYYEVLFERDTQQVLRPAFIEAVVS